MPLALMAPLCGCHPALAPKGCDKGGWAGVSQPVRDLRGFAPYLQGFQCQNKAHSVTPCAPAHPGFCLKQAAERAFACANARRERRKAAGVMGVCQQM